MGADVNFSIRVLNAVSYSGVHYSLRAALGLTRAVEHSLLYILPLFFGG